ncbi:hypothetical protein, partial [Klebsiella pneumoniae]|uniref:hypothetical protein n=1 Tax=Klebsiella pneumoniae TaxID=573 RepID=UPI001CDB7B29
SRQQQRRKAMNRQWILMTIFRSDPDPLKVPCICGVFFCPDFLTAARNRQKNTPYNRVTVRGDVSCRWMNT